MADWNELFRNPDFREYRKKQVELLAQTVAGDIRANRLDNVKIKLDFARDMLKLPESLTSDAEVRNLLDTQRFEDIAGVTGYLMREFLTGE